MKRMMSLLLLVTLLLSMVPVFRVSAADVIPTNWNVAVMGGANYSVTTVTDSKTGDGHISVKFFDTIYPDRYIRVMQSIPVVPGKTYLVGYSVKGTKVPTNECYAMVNWGKRLQHTTYAGTTFDWTSFEFLWTAGAKESAMELSFAFGDVCGELCIDDVYVYEYAGGKMGENLVLNGDFNTDPATLSAPSTDAIGGTTAEEKLQLMKDSTSFKLDNFEELYGGVRYAPVYPAKEITIDGDLSDWAAYPAINLPTKSDQYVIYGQDSYDASGIFRYAWDEQYLYLAVDVTDDIHYGDTSANYWMADSIQFTLAETGKSLTEIGLSIDSNTGESDVIATGLTDDVRRSILLKTSRAEGKLYYEAAIPWTVKYDSRPESILFNGLLNDNDGNGRNYCLEFSYGIAIEKSTAQNPQLFMLDEVTDYDTWVEGPMNVTQMESNTFDFYYVNRGSAKTVKYQMPGSSAPKTVTLAEGQGIHDTFTTVFNNVGVDKATVLVTTNGEEKEVSYGVEVALNVAMFDSAYFSGLRAKRDELKNLLEECEAKGLITDYETVNYTVYDRFVKQMEAEILAGVTVRSAYYDSCLTDLYAETKANLTAYLAGEKTPVLAPKYQTSDVKIEGQKMVGTATINGKEETRPLFFVGTLGFGEDKVDLPKFNDYGFNAIQFEIGANAILKPKGSIAVWGIGTNGVFDAKATSDNTTSNSGDYSMKIECDSEVIPNCYLNITQEVEVKPNTTYYYGLAAKGENVSGTWFSMDGWNDMRGLDGTYDWRNFDYVLTTGPEQTKAVFRVVCDRAIGGLNVDDLYLKEGKDGDNLLQNGDFEQALEERGLFAIDYTEIERYQEYLAQCEENNIWVGMLLTNHYFPDFLYDLYPDLKQADNAPGFTRFELSHPVAREALALFYEIAVPAFKDYISLNNFILANEPWYCAAYSEYSLPAYRAYLSDIYGGDLAKLNAEYGASYASFDEIDYPYDPETDKLFDDGSKHFYDYVNFSRSVLTDFHQFCRDEIKKWAPEIPVSTKAQNHFGATDWRDPRNMGVKSGTDFEALLDVSDFAGNDAWFMLQSPVDASTLNEKFFYYDAQRTYKEAPIYNSEDHIIGDGDIRYLPEFAPHMRTDYWQGAIHGRTASTFWVWSSGYHPGGDMSNTVGLRPDCIQQIGHTALNLNRLSYEVTAFQEAPADTAVLYSAASRIYSQAHMNHAFSAYKALLYSGEKVDILTDTIIDRIHNYKLVVLPGITNIDDSTLRVIDEYIKKGGKVVFLSDQSVIKNTDNQPVDAALLQSVVNGSVVIPATANGTSMATPSFGDLKTQLQTLLKEMNLYNIDIIDTATGKTVEDAEWQAIEYNGKTLIDICSYKFYSPKNIQIVIDGVKVAASKDLISGEAYGDTLPLEPWTPILLEIGE